MDIRSGKGYPSSALSNFAGHQFTVDGVACNSMEGFLQSLKFKNPEMQRYVCTLVGKTAKSKGKAKNWWRKQCLYWQGREIGRHTEAYQALLTRAYEAMFLQSESFRNALIACQGCTLTHSIGTKDPHRTILTESEFINQLTQLREKYLKPLESGAQVILSQPQNIKR